MESWELQEHEEYINDQLHIAFYVSDIPNNSSFECACNNVKDYENKTYYAVRKILAGGLLSDYAVFRVYNR